MCSKQEKSMRENMSRVIIPVKERIEKCVKLIEVHQTGRTETSAIFHSSQAEKLTHFTDAH